jgi:hypothetical protein
MHAVGKSGSGMDREWRDLGYNRETSASASILRLDMETRYAEMKGPEVGKDGVSKPSALVSIVCALPLVAFFVYATWLKPISPFYANYDPEFQYLLNSLEVFKGSPYGYVDHPGTPLEVVGSGIYAASYPLLGMDPAAFIRYHLQNPGLFLTTAHAFVLLANIACIWYFIRVVRSTGSRADALLAAALAVLSFAIHPLAFSAVAIWSHNSFGFPFGTLFLLVLFKMLHKVRRERTLPTQELIGLGLAAGILSSVTIYLASWIICTIAVVLILYRLRGLSWAWTLRAGFVVALASVAGFFVAVLPVLGKMPTFFTGVGQLLAHENLDPQSAAGAPVAATFSRGFIDLYHSAPALFISAGLSLLLVGVALAAQRNIIQDRPELCALALGLILQMVLLTIAIIEHPVSIYLLSIAATIPVLVLVGIRLLPDGLIGLMPFRQGLAAIIFVGFLAAFAQSVAAQRANAERITETVEQTTRSLEEHARATGQSPADLFVLWTYRSYAPCFSLWFGNDSTGRVFRKEIGEICYRQPEFNIWSQKVVSSQGVSQLSDARWDAIIGCEDGFKSPALAALRSTETYPSLKLECGSLKIAFNRP